MNLIESYSRCLANYSTLNIIDQAPSRIHNVSSLVKQRHAARRVETPAGFNVHKVS